MQTELFGNSAPQLPDGFTYLADALPQPLQKSLLMDISALPFKNFAFHGFEGKRRVVSFGWKYDFDTERVREIGDLPRMLLPARDIAARVAGLAPTELKQALVTEYSPGAPIGWHRDKMVFGVVVGVSLLSPCTLRLRRKVGGKWERASVVVDLDLYTCFLAKRGPSGSTPYHQSRNCVIRLPFAKYASNSGCNLVAYFSCPAIPGQLYSPRPGNQTIGRVWAAMCPPAPWLQWRLATMD